MEAKQRILVVADKTADSPDLIVELRRRAERAAGRIRQEGLRLEDVIVGDPDPFAAVGDALHAREFDEVVVSVLPHGLSKWLALGLPARLRRSTDLPPAGTGARTHRRLISQFRGSFRTVYVRKEPRNSVVAV